MKVSDKKIAERIKRLESPYTTFNGHQWKVGCSIISDVQLEGYCDEAFDNIATLFERTIMIKDRKKDFLGKELKVGDEVVCIELDYRNLIKCKIISLTPKMANVRAEEGYEFKQFHEQMIKVYKFGSLEEQLQVSSDKCRELHVENHRLKKLLGEEE